MVLWWEKTSRAAAESAAADSLWAPLVAAEFSEREQRAVLFPRSSLYTESSASVDNDNGEGDDSGADASGGGDGESGVMDPAAAAAVAAAASNSSPSNDDSTGDVESGGYLSSNSSSRGDGNGRGREGASRRLYITLHNARARRAAIAAEQRRRSSILEMSALGRLGRAWGLYPWAPYLPRGPHYQYSQGPAFPEHNWGPGIGHGAGATPEGADMGAHAHPHPMWGGIGSWGRNRTGPWRGFGGGVAGICPTGVGVGGGAWSLPGQAGVPTPPHGQGRWNRGRFGGYVSGM